MKKGGLHIPPSGVEKKKKRERVQNIKKKGLPPQCKAFQILSFAEKKKKKEKIWLFFRTQARRVFPNAPQGGKNL